MKIKSLLLVSLSAILLAGCGAPKAAVTPGNKGVPLTTKVAINAMAVNDQPFTVLVPHSTGRLFTFVTIGADKAQAASLDLEYQSGDLLKAASATLPTPITNPFMKAIILGSCSTGGKCTFDKDLTSGTMKFKLNYPGQDVTNILKGDFVFLLGQTNLPDGKVVFTPAKASAKENLMMMDSFGLPKPSTQETLLYPVVISAVNDKLISGTLTFNLPGVTSAAIYDGQTYQPLKISQKDNVITAAISQKPWSMNATIVRDDDKGNSESLTLYLLGPIVLYK